MRAVRRPVALVARACERADRRQPRAYLPRALLGEVVDYRREVLRRGGVRPAESPIRRHPIELAAKHSSHSRWRWWCCCCCGVGLAFCGQWLRCCRGEGAATGAVRDHHGGGAAGCGGEGSNAEVASSSSGRQASRAAIQRRGSCAQPQQQPRQSQLGRCCCTLTGSPLAWHA